MKNISVHIIPKCISLIWNTNSFVQCTILVAVSIHYEGNRYSTRAYFHPY